MVRKVPSSYRQALSHRKRLSSMPKSTPANQPLHIGLRTVPKDGVRLQNLDANLFAFRADATTATAPARPKKSARNRF